MSLLCYYLPSSIWIVMPLISIYAIGRKFVQVLSNKAEKEN